MTSRGFESDSFATQFAERLRQYGLQQPAQVALEVGRPLAFVAGQLLWVTQPLLGLLMPRSTVSQVAGLLENPDSLETLITLLGSEDVDRKGGT